VFDLDVGIVVDCAQCGQVLFLHYNNYSATAIQNDKSSNHNKLLRTKPIKYRIIAIDIRLYI
jgi:hypothetical protein